MTLLHATGIDRTVGTATLLEAKDSDGAETMSGVENSINSCFARTPNTAEIHINQLNPYIETVNGSSELFDLPLAIEKIPIKTENFKPISIVKI